MESYIFECLSTFKVFAPHAFNNFLCSQSYSERFSIPQNISLIMHSGFSFDEYYQNSTISLNQQMHQQHNHQPHNRLPPIYSKPKTSSQIQDASNQSPKLNSKCSALSLSPIKTDCTYTKLIRNFNSFFGIFCQRCPITFQLTANKIKSTLEMTE